MTSQSTTVVRYYGLLRSCASWAKVGRQLVLALAETGVSVCASELSDEFYDPRFRIPRKLKSLIDRKVKETVALTFSDPTEYGRFVSEIPCVGILVHEATAWPALWIAGAQRYLYRAVVPSHFCYRTLADSGFPAPRISIVPHGVDTSVYSPKSRIWPGERSCLRFLFVGTISRRKGLDLLLSAFSKAFAPSDKVTLVLRINVQPNSNKRAYVDNQWERNVTRMRNRGYKVSVIRQWLSEMQMASLYRSVDLLCQPSRGEGFCCPVLEAMACGTPVLTTGWSGTVDLVDESVGYPIRNFALVPAGDMLYGRDSNTFGGLMAEPNPVEIAETLRAIYVNRCSLQGRAGCAANRAREYSWKVVAMQMGQLLAMQQ
jgi:glycosyltransferase involved in cell wall biosynthesis